MRPSLTFAGQARVTCHWTAAVLIPQSTSHLPSMAISPPHVALPFDCCIISCKLFCYGLRSSWAGICVSWPFFCYSPRLWPTASLMQWWLRISRARATGRHQTAERRIISFLPLQPCVHEPWEPGMPADEAASRAWRPRLSTSVQL
jgi:hypothetical protein